MMEELAMAAPVAGGAGAAGADAWDKTFPEPDKMEARYIKNLGSVKGEK